jgi:hypothetical protein
MAQFFIPKVGERRMTVRAALSLWTTGDALSSVATPLAHCRKNSNHYRVTAVLSPRNRVITRLYPL